MADTTNTLASLARVDHAFTHPVYAGMNKADFRWHVCSGYAPNLELELTLAVLAPTNMCAMRLLEDKGYRQVTYLDVYDLIGKKEF